MLLSLSFYDFDYRNSFCCEICLFTILFIEMFVYRVERIIIKNAHRNDVFIYINSIYYKRSIYLVEVFISFSNCDCQANILSSL